MSTLRWYQSDLRRQIYEAWQQPGIKSVLAVAPTGAGKTVLMGDIARNTKTGIAIAHRQELVGQISLALAREGVMHNLICSDSVRKSIQTMHIQDTGRRWFDRQAPWSVAGVDTIVRADPAPWMDNINLVMMDEAHHVLCRNKWGRAWELFGNAWGLGVTATPERSDGCGLGRDYDGVFDAIVQTVSMRDLIDQGYLTDYDYVGVQDGLKGFKVEVGTTGDYKAQELSKYFKDNPQITGDIVKHYTTHAMGKLGVTFAVDIDHAGRIADEYRRNGIPAEVLSGKTPDLLRRKLLRDFAERKFLQLVSVDILGEGFDLPAIEVVSFARPTASYSLYVQQWGRVLRLMVDKAHLAAWEDYTIAQRLEIIAASRKPKAIILDHVGNLYRHMGPPDKIKSWSLASREKRGGGGGGIPQRLCLNPQCLKSYEAYLSKCPRCGEPAPLPAERGLPKEVAGNLLLYTPEILAQLRGEVARIDRPAVTPVGVPMHVKSAIIEKHHDRVRAQKELREVMGLWAGKNNNLAQHEKEQLFYYMFQMDALTALTLGAGEARKLREAIFTTL